MDEPIKKVGDWNVLTTIRVGHKEIALGENPNAEKDQRYLCCYVEQIAVWDTYPEALVSDDFAEIAKIFGERITQAADEILKKTSTSSPRSVKTVRSIKTSAIPFQKMTIWKDK